MRTKNSIKVYTYIVVIVVIVIVVIVVIVIKIITNYKMVCNNSLLV